MKQLNIKSILLIIITFFASSLNAFSLEIVYPKAEQVTINAKSTFFIGSTIPGAELTINETKAKVWEDGSFVEVVPLVEGENIFKIKALEKDKIEEKTIKIIKKSPAILPCQTEEYQAFSAGEFQMATVIKEGIPLRSAPNEDGQRLTQLSKGTNIILEGKKGHFYKVSLGDNSNCWVLESHIAQTCQINERFLATICETNFDDDKNFNLIKFKLNLPVAYKIVENENNLELTIYGIKSTGDLALKIAEQKKFQTVKIKSCLNNNLVIEIPSTEKLWGYDCFYEENQLILKKRKTPEISQGKPLNNIKIAIDAGHGGMDSGAVGPTGEKEKNINFDIVKKLENELKLAGAEVVIIRETDQNVDLYERVTKAKKAEALICLSIHANALADGGNPYIKHGTSTFYYNNEAKELAQTLKLQLIKELGTFDDGSGKASFVMTRPTTPLSVLIEVAYMIHPQEYQLLLDENFRQKAAVAIKNGLEAYLIKSAQKP